MRFKGIKINEDSKKMADLLRSGYTMLNIACPVCNNPIFRDPNGEIFCPICNRKALLVDNNSINVNKKSDFKESLDDSNQKKHPPDYDNIHNFVKEVILDKIKWISDRLKTETQFEMIETHINLLLNLYKLLDNLLSLVQD